MPVIANTPEALIARTDSCDPETTCQGLTNSGKPCRRALGDPTDRYCWQHKDQAAPESPGTSTPSAMNPNKPRTSIDTLLDRIGILNINDGASEKWRPSRPTTTTSNNPPKRQKKRTICCCFEVIEEEEIRPPRPVSARPPSQAAAPGPVPQANLLSPNSQIPTRPSAQTSSHYSSTSSGIPESWIPADLSAEAASTLASELDKPISERDEPGYIYMFWLTPEETTGNGGGARGPPPAEVASSLLPHHHKSSGGGGARDRAVSDAIRTARDLRALTSAPSATSPGTIRLKIGRANNVQRRLNEWSRQCGHHVTLIRYYPYTPSTPQPSPARFGGGTVHDNAALEPGRKVPFVHRVERLIHLELGDVRVRDMGKCPECGREHKEWFEVTAEKSSLKRVDDCIRRWVKWAEVQEKQSR